MGLIELMISMTLGLLVAAGVVSMFIGTARANANILTTVRLEQEMHSVMDLILRDLRRAGSHGRPTLLASGGGNPFSLGGAAAFAGEPAASCIVFSYDLDQDGLLDAATGDERFGFRLRDQTLELRRSGLDCAANGWEALTDRTHTRITALQFSVTAKAAGAVGVRDIRISLTGQPVGDDQTSRTLVREIRVRNDVYAP